MEYEYNTGVWRKAEDQQPAHLWYPQKLKIHWAGRVLRASKIGASIVINNQRKALEAIEVTDDAPGAPNTSLTRKIEIFRSDQKVIRMHETVAFKGHERVVAATHHLLQGSSIKLFEYSFQKMTSRQISNIHLPLSKERTETILGLYCCPRSRYLFVITTTNARFLSRIVVFELEEFLLKKRQELDLFASKTKYIDAGDFLGYFGDLLVFAALTCSEPEVELLTIEYNCRENSVRERRDLRRRFEGKFPNKMVAVAGSLLYSSDDRANLIKVLYKFGNQRTK